MALTITQKNPIGQVKIQLPDGKVQEHIENMAEVISEKPMANVGMKVGVTKNLGNYESVRIDVSLYLPCDPEDQKINDTFDTISNWVDLKMQGIMEEYEEAK